LYQTINFGILAYIFNKLSIKEVPFRGHKILCYIDPLLDNDRETNNETSAIAMQQLRKYATGLELLLGSGPSATIEVLLEVVFYMFSPPRLYHSTDRVNLVKCSAVQ
jgi:hypothetical protein